MRIPQVIMAVGLVVLAGLLLTQQRHPLRYNPSAEVTLSGVVKDVKDFYCPVSGGEGTHLMVATDNGTVEVHVAPSRFLLDKQVQFSKGDQVEVTGSRIMFRGHPAVIARTIVRGTQTVALRKADGKPAWLE